MDKDNSDEGSTEKPKGFFKELGYDPDRIRIESQTRDELAPLDIKPKRKIDSSLQDFNPVRAILISIGLSLILASALFAVFSIEKADPVSIDDKTEYRIFNNVLSSNELNYEFGNGFSLIDNGKLMSVSGNQIKTELVETEDVFSSYDFVIEIIDVSTYPDTYTRSIDVGNEISTTPLPTDGSGIKIITYETGVNIYVSDNEIHVARFIMYIWEA